MLKKKKFTNDGNKQKKLILRIIVLVALVIVAILSIEQQKKQKGSLEQETNVIEHTKEEVKSIYRADTEIKAGEFAENVEENFIKETLNIKEIPEDAITDLSILKGKRIRKVIKKDEILQISMIIDQSLWYEQGDRFVEQQFMEGVIPVTYTNLVGNLVDIVLFRKKEQDSVVVAKTVIVSATETRLGFNLNQTERECLKEAATEEGGLYLQIYLDENQVASTVTYEPQYMQEIESKKKGGENE